METDKYITHGSNQNTKRRQHRHSKLTAEHKFLGVVVGVFDQFVWKDALKLTMAFSLLQRVSLGQHHLPVLPVCPAFPLCVVEEDPH